MAQRGLWAEARFRFEQAARLDPSNARAVGNLAVAYEALGRFEEAQATYKRALEIDPGNVEIKRNQARFEEFFAGYKSGKALATPASAQPEARKPDPSDPGKE
jgi:Flp pilus assembly protein TadD